MDLNQKRNGVTQNIFFRNTLLVYPISNKESKLISGQNKVKKNLLFIFEAKLGTTQNLIVIDSLCMAFL